MTADGSAALQSALAREGYAFVRGVAMRELLSAAGPLVDWEAFAASWNRLELDLYMADGGRYRRRRHATYTMTGRTLVREPHRPHFQPIDYNPLNGGIERWFEPIEETIGVGATMAGIISFCGALFGALKPAVREWHVEVHQFRIEARPGEQGRPTPEGLHRDGVDYVLVLLINRSNIARGMTSIHGPDGSSLGHFTLTDPFDAALLDDRCVAHGVTPVEAIDPERAAHRDVLVVTFKAI